MAPERKPGKVYLIGSGPGDPNLLTVKARTLLDEADVVAYDSLISPALLASLSARSLNIPVGYRGYGSSKLSYGIHPTVIEMARKGKTVVRLKSGDPFIFGRGSQECSALNEEGILFEVVPGISSGLGAAISAGFPLTHRDFSSNVVFASGHDLRGGSPCNSNWSSIAQTNGTVVIYMAASKVKENCNRLIEFGKGEDTPAIFVASATCGDEEVVQGTLKDLGDLCKAIHPKKPAIIIIGEVVRTRELFNWRKDLPLNQKQFLVLRQRNSESEMAKILKSLGATVVEAPKFRSKIINPLPSISKEGNYIIGQKESFTFFLQHLMRSGKDIRELLNARFFVMDEKTRCELNSFGIKEAALLKGHCHKAIVESDLPRDLIIVTRKEGRKSLQADLEGLGHKVTRLEVYEREDIYLDIEAPRFDGVFCGSSSSIDSLTKSSWFERCQNAPFFTIGKKTHDRALMNNLKCFMSDEDTLDSMVTLILRKVRGV